MRKCGKTTTEAGNPRNTLSREAAMQRRNEKSAGRETAQRKIKIDFLTPKNDQKRRGIESTRWKS